MKGKVGQVVVKRRDGKYYVTTPPIQENDPSAKQLEQRQKFKRAILYARKATDDDSPTREAYEKAAATAQAGRSPMNIAVSDWFHPPRIDQMDFSEYHGKAGDKISIIVENEVSVKRVWIVIRDGAGNELERGEATMTKNPEWAYTTTVDLPGADVSFIITVTDLPGNTSRSTLDKHLETNTAEVGPEAGTMDSMDNMSLEIEPINMPEEQTDAETGPDEGLEGDDTESFPEEELEAEA